LDTTGTPYWCKKCRAAYKREYVATQSEMKESRGYAAGISAAKAALAVKFDNYGRTGYFSGVEIAQLIRQADLSQV
jgi:hypothetical protein